MAEIIKITNLSPEAKRNDIQAGDEPEPWNVMSRDDMSKFRQLTGPLRQEGPAILLGQVTHQYGEYQGRATIQYKGRHPLQLERSQWSESIRSGLGVYRRFRSLGGPPSSSIDNSPPTIYVGPGGQLHVRQTHDIAQTPQEKVIHDRFRTEVAAIGPVISPWARLARGGYGEADYSDGVGVVSVHSRRPGDHVLWAHTIVTPEYRIVGTRHKFSESGPPSSRVQIEKAGSLWARLRNWWHILIRGAPTRVTTMHFGKNDKTYLFDSNTGQWKLLPPIV